MSEPKITVHRYEHAQQVGWTGYVEPDDKSWIVFFAPGRAAFYGKREPDTGAVIETAGTVASTTE